MVDLLGFSPHNNLWGFERMVWKTEISSEQQFSVYLVNVWSKSRMGVLLRAERKATVTQSTTHYKQGMHLWKQQHNWPWSRSSTGTEDHTGSYNCQLRRWKLMLHLAWTHSKVAQNIQKTLNLIGRIRFPLHFKYIPRMLCCTDIWWMEVTGVFFDLLLL